MPSNTATFLYFDTSTCFGIPFHTYTLPFRSPSQNSVQHIRAVMRATWSTHLTVRQCTTVVSRVFSPTSSQVIPWIYFCTGYFKVYSPVN